MEKSLKAVIIAVLILLITIIINQFDLYDKLKTNQEAVLSLQELEKQRNINLILKSELIKVQKDIDDVLNDGWYSKEEYDTTCKYYMNYDDNCDSDGYYKGVERTDHNLGLGDCQTIIHPLIRKDGHSIFINSNNDSDVRKDWIDLERICEIFFIDNCLYIVVASDTDQQVSRKFNYYHYHYHYNRHDVVEEVRDVVKNELDRYYGNN